MQLFFIQTVTAWVGFPEIPEVKNVKVAKTREATSRTRIIRSAMGGIEIEGRAMNSLQRLFVLSIPGADFPYLLVQTITIFSRQPGTLATARVTMMFGIFAKRHSQK